MLAVGKTGLGWDRKKNIFPERKTISGPSIEGGPNQQSRFRKLVLTGAVEVFSSKRRILDPQPPGTSPTDGKGGAEREAEGTPKQAPKLKEAKASL